MTILKKLIPKTNDTITEEKKPAKKVVEEYMHESNFSKQIITEDGLIQLANRLARWADKKDSFLLSEFYCDEGITSVHLDRWIKLCPELGKAKAYALRRLHIKREKEASKVHGIYKESMIVRSLHRYSTDWDEDNKYHAGMKALTQAVQNKLEGKNTEYELVAIPDIPEEGGNDI